MSERQNIGIKIKIITTSRVLENIFYKWRCQLLKVLTTYGSVTKTKMNLGKTFNSTKVMLFCMGVELGCLN